MSRFLINRLILHLNLRKSIDYYECRQPIPSSILSLGERFLTDLVTHSVGREDVVPCRTASNSEAWQLEARLCPKQFNLSRRTSFKQFMGDFTHRNSLCRFVRAQMWLCWCFGGTSLCKNGALTPMHSHLSGVDCIDFNWWKVNLFESNAQFLCCFPILSWFTEGKYSSLISSSYFPKIVIIVVEINSGILQLARSIEFVLKSALGSILSRLGTFQVAQVDRNLPKI